MRSTPYDAVVRWAPRAVSILFVLFLSVFSFDAFGTYHGWQAVAAFLVHMIPAFVLAAVVIVAWWYELFGAVVFLTAAGGYVLMVGPGRPWSWYAFISGPAAIAGFLYLVSWYRGRRNVPQ